MKEFTKFNNLYNSVKNKMGAGIKTFVKNDSKNTLSKLKKMDMS